jgi:hypothetical protein
MASRLGSENKSTAQVKQLVQSQVNFKKLIKAAEMRALKGSSVDFKTLMEYGFGKAPQPLEHSGEIKLPIKIIEDMS